MNVLAIVLAAATLGAPADDAFAKAQLKLLEAENKSLREAIKKIGDQNIWLKDEVVRLTKKLEKLPKPAVSKTAKDPPKTTSAGKPKDPSKTTPADKPKKPKKPVFISLEELAASFPKELYRKGREKADPRAVRRKKLNEWVYRNVYRKATKLDVRVKFLDPKARPNRNFLNPHMRGPGGKRYFKKDGQGYEWRCERIEARFKDTQTAGLKRIKGGDTVTIKGEIDHGEVYLRQTTLNGPARLECTMILYLKNCEVVSIAPR
ncbi:hypothetical protein LCGC14_1680400 [marine sediment metagenome]|uniref:Uncharacterized protein n=1 Tax=marine sediment metagenome TaxID=412755 RepID=A0A0F9HP89_9ZZZZ